MENLPAEILAESASLFDDVRSSDIDATAHADFVIARVLDRGTLSSVRALVHAYGLERIRTFFREGRSFQVSPRTAALWQAFLELDPGQCISRSSPRIKSPFWRD